MKDKKVLGFILETPKINSW